MSDIEERATATADDRRVPPENGRTPRSIVLFSDGTGNSSAKLFKTNVWRMYEAVDLGPAAAGKRDQVSYYDDGVGTSAFRPLAVLGGAVGYGLKRNVLDIYRFACRNYQPGDDIFAFGFSRGGFTIRLAVALIASQGLIKSSSEAELRWKSRAAYRAFRSEFLPRRLQFPTKLLRVLRRAVLRIVGRVPPRTTENHQPNIQFVGVWDTVAAYGGPIAEITRAIDNWIFPLSMPDYHLSTKVLCARHALALDDERDAFRPLLWDEVHEQGLVDAGEVADGRLQQVWFTGMHSDVGGGYSDESLSYVSLLWMMEEAERAGLRTLKVIKDRFVALASSYGPIHDSRAGIAAYYRYQPRKISAWIDPVDRTTLSLRDPAIADDKGRPHGLLREVHVHESVMNRIARGTDRYAPITLPVHFKIVPPQAEGENVRQSDSENPAPTESTDGLTPSKPMISSDLRLRLEDKAGSLTRAEATEAVWDFVWGRRVLYFTTLVLTLVLLALPLFASRLPEPPLLADGRTWVGGIIRLLALLLPDFAADWVEVYADNPFYFLLLLALIGGCLGASTWLERRLRDESRRVWRATIEDEAPIQRVSWLQRFRNSDRYQRLLHVFKWRFLPDWIVTPLIAFLLAWLGVAVYTQTRLPFAESNWMCRSSSGTIPDVSVASMDFFTRDLCSASVGHVREGERYIVLFDVVDPWYDASLAATPEGIPAGDFPFGTGYLAAPLRRVVNANYLQPVIEIRETEDSRNLLHSHVHIYPLQIQPVADAKALYRSEFEAPTTGELFLFVNDAMIPITTRWFDYRYFYEASGSGSEPERGNRGTACVTVQRANVPTAATSTPPAGSVCARVASRG